MADDPEAISLSTASQGKKVLEGCWLVTGFRHAMTHRMLAKKVPCYGVYVLTGGR